MHPTDRARAIQLLRSIGLLALDCESALKRSDSGSTTLLAETVSLIEGDVEKIEALKIWTNG